jgi:hypothetical protein
MMLFLVQQVPLLEFLGQPNNTMEENKKKYSLGSVDGRIDYAMDFFTERGFTRQAAAGIVGNLLAESGINPKSEQYGGGPGRGIAQWSVDQRWQTYLKFAKNRDLDPQDLNAQLRFIIHEMPSQMGESAKTIKSMTDQNAAAKLFMDKYERPGKPNWDRRVSETARALRAGTSLSVVKNNRGPAMRAEERVVTARPEPSAVQQAKQFFDDLVPDTVKNFGDDALTQARQFFDNLFPAPKSTVDKDINPKFVNPNKLQAL